MTTTHDIDTLALVDQLCDRDALWSTELIRGSSSRDIRDKDGFLCTEIIPDPEIHLTFKAAEKGVTFAEMRALLVQGLEAGVPSSSVSPTAIHVTVHLGFNGSL